MKTINAVDINGKRVLFRVDFNVPLDANGEVAEDSRIKAVLPTLAYALEQNAKVILSSHLGRPKGQVVPEMSLAPVAKRLGRLLGKDVKMAPDCIGPAVQALIDQMKPGDVLLLENLRFHPEEQKNDDGFAKALAELGDVYINDAFAVSHRADASVTGITRYVSVSAAGFLLAKEIEYFDKAMTNPKRPFAAVIGGAKVSDKLKALENMLEHVNKLLIGGAMANTFLKSRGIAVGKSKIEVDLISVAETIVKKAQEKKVEFLLPVDAVVADQLTPDARAKVFSIGNIPEEGMILDIGPETSDLYARALADAATIIWNGPMGVFEMDAFSRGTLQVARALAASNALTIVGGGDTAAAVHKAGVADKMGYISTGGGAFLELLEGKRLPGVAALQ